jgi:succinyl-CoA synthetase alpha subunit/DNA-binding transcriptional ArsR family regulator
MRVAKRLSEQEGILQVAALMGTEKNKALLDEIDVRDPETSKATPSDLIVAVKADSQEALTSVIENIDQWLNPNLGPGIPCIIRTLEEAVAVQSRSNLAVISVPGSYAAREARKALEHGLNVFLFTDNVPLESEISLKKYARERGLIVMGPDCGTAIIGGIGVGFANAVRRGPIGIIGASGTGIQEFTSLVHRAGSGISHAIGIGSRDLSDAVGGISFLSALDALESDPQTEIITILSKPPGELALSNLIPRILKCHKPIVACFLGLKQESFSADIRHRTARTLDDAAAIAVQIVTGHSPTPFDANSSHLQKLAGQERVNKNPEQRYLRGIFAGGTFCFQAQQILQGAGMVVHSNAPLYGNLKLCDPMKSEGHTLLDMGTDDFTVGKPHPMIDSRLRRERILAEGQDPQVAILFLDFVLGFNSSPDPAGELVSAIEEVKGEAKKRGGSLSVVASICGTEGDPQNLPRQVKVLEEAGVIVFPSSAQAARFCALLAASLSEATRAK